MATARAVEGRVRLAARRALRAIMLCITFGALLFVSAFMAGMELRRWKERKR